MSAIVLQYEVFPAVSLRGAEGRPVRLTAPRKHINRGRIVGEGAGLGWGAGVEFWTLRQGGVLHRRRKGNRLEGSCFVK